MKSLIAAVTFALVLAAHAFGEAVSPSSPPIRAMSFNLRYATAPDGPDAWPLRRELLAGAIAAFVPDVLGAQEVLATQADFLRERFATHDFVGVGRTDGKAAGEFSPTLSRRDRFDVLASGTFWLSPTPERAGSIGWDAAITRICSWARLRDRRAGGATFVFASAHFDHKGERARVESAKLIRERLTRSAEGAPILLVGDFNASVGSPTYAALFDGDDAFVDVFRAAHPTPPAEGEGTFHGFTGKARPHRLDRRLAGGRVDGGRGDDRPLQPRRAVSVGSLPGDGGRPPQADDAAGRTRMRAIAACRVSHVGTPTCDRDRRPIAARSHPTCREYAKCGTRRRRSAACRCCRDGRSRCPRRCDIVRTAPTGLAHVHMSVIAPSVDLKSAGDDRSSAARSVASRCRSSIRD